MEIRPLEADEIERLVDTLWLSLGREMAKLDDFNALSANSRENAIAYHERAIADDERTILVAIEGGEFVGFIYAKREEAMPVFEREYNLHIIEIYVRGESRQQGIASELLAEIEAWEKAQDCEWASLMVHVDNHAARSLYENNEFEVKRNLFAKPLW